MEVPTKTLPGPRSLRAPIPTRNSGRALSIPGVVARSWAAALEPQRNPMHRPVSSAVWLFALAATLVAQGTTHVAYPQDSTTWTNTNLVPLGQDPATTGHEARAQMVIPRCFLPSTGGQIVGIEVIAGTPKTVNYSSLTLSLDHLVSATPFPILATTFAANLAAPIPVFRLTNQPITYPGGAWYRLTFQQPFQYNGQDHLVLDFVKYIPSYTSGLGMASLNGERTDLPPLLTAAGYFGSGAATRSVGANASFPLRIRLVFAGTTPTTVISSPIVGGVYWGIGTNIVVATHGAPSANVVQAIDLAPPGLGGRPTPLSLPSLTGVGWLQLGPASLVFPFPAVVMPPTGVLLANLTIPYDPALRGLTVVFQSIVCSPTSASWSSASDCTIK